MHLVLQPELSITTTLMPGCIGFHLRSNPQQPESHSKQFTAICRAVKSPYRQWLTVWRCSMEPCGKKKKEKPAVRPDSVKLTGPFI